MIPESPQVLFDKHWPLARKLALSFARHTRHDKIDDFLSVAKVTLWEIVTSSKADHPNLPAYINEMVRGQTRDFLLNDHVVRVPKDQAKAGTPLPAIFNSGNLGKAQNEGSISDNFFAGTQQPKHYNNANEDHNLRLEEAIRALGLKRSDRDIVRMKLDGLTDEDIAQRLGKSRKTIWHVSKRIRDTYSDACKDSDILLREPKK